MVNGHDTVEPDGEIKLVSALWAAGSSTRAAMFNAKLWGVSPFAFRCGSWRNMSTSVITIFERYGARGGYGSALWVWRFSARVLGPVSAPDYIFYRAESPRESFELRIYPARA